MPIDRQSISLEESCLRDCVAKLGLTCGGPTLSGLDGYVCEVCFGLAVEAFDAGGGVDDVACEYCGASDKTFRLGRPMCRACVDRAAAMLRDWRTRSGGTG